MVAKATVAQRIILSFGRKATIKAASNGKNIKILRSISYLAKTKVKEKIIPNKI